MLDPELFSELEEPPLLLPDTEGLFPEELLSEVDPEEPLSEEGEDPEEPALLLETSTPQDPKAD